MVIPDELKHKALKMHDATMICAPRISQLAGIEALSQPSDHNQKFATVLDKRRELICQRLDMVSHVFSNQRPEAAYYVFPRVTAERTASKECAIDLLNDTKVAVTPSSAFGPSGEHHVGMAYCVNEDTINLKFDRIEDFFR